MFELRESKFVKKSVLEFKNIENDNETKYRAFYSNLKEEALINEKSIGSIFESIYITIISNIQNFLRKGSG